MKGLSDNGNLDEDKVGSDAMRDHDYDYVKFVQKLSSV